MEEQDREYLVENVRRVELWEETPKATSGRCSDMTEVEKEKLIDMLYSMLESRDGQIAGLQEEIRLLREQSRDQHLDLQTRLDRMEERAVKAESDKAKSDSELKKADKQIAELKATIASLNAVIESLMDGSVVEKLKEQLHTSSQYANR